MFAHDVAEGFFAVGDGSKISGAEALGDEEGGALVSVLGVPDVDVGAIFIEELHDFGGGFVGGGVHGGLAAFVDVVDVGTEGEKIGGGGDGVVFERLFLSLIHI